MKSVNRMFAAMLCILLLLAVSSASAIGSSQSPKGVSFQWAMPSALDGPILGISSIAVCAADKATSEGTYDPNILVEKIDGIPGLKAVSPRSITRSVKDTDMEGASASERKVIMAAIATATEADAVLYIKQNGGVIVGGKGGLVRAKRTFQINVTLEIYVSATQKVLRQDISTFIEQGASMLGVQKISEQDIREAFAANLIARIVPSTDKRIASN